MSVIFIDFNNANNKYSKCKHRSTNKYEVTKNSCCGKKVKSMEHKCDLRQILPLSKEICDNCTLFEEKNE